MRQGLVAQESTSLEDISIKKKNKYKKVGQQANHICLFDQRKRNAAV